MSATSATSQPVERLLVGFDDACRALGVSRRTVGDLIASGRLPSLKLGRRRLVPAAALDALVADLLEAEARRRAAAGRPRSAFEVAADLLDPAWSLEGAVMTTTLPADFVHLPPVQSRSDHFEIPQPPKRQRSARSVADFLATADFRNAVVRGRARAMIADGNLPVPVLRALEGALADTQAVSPPPPPPVNPLAFRGPVEPPRPSMDRLAGDGSGPAYEQRAALTAAELELVRALPEDPALVDVDTARFLLSVRDRLPARSADLRLLKQRLAPVEEHHARAAARAAAEHAIAVAEAAVPDPLPEWQLRQLVELVAPLVAGEKPQLTSVEASRRARQLVVDARTDLELAAREAVAGAEAAANRLPPG